MGKKKKNKKNKKKKKGAGGPTYGPSALARRQNALVYMYVLAGLS